MTATARSVAVAGLVVAAGSALLLGQGRAVAAPDHRPAHHHATPPVHIAPVRTAWFDLTRATTAAPGLPRPGVHASDLVVEGITVTTGQLPVDVPVKVPDLTAVAALSALAYRIPHGAAAATLTLHLRGLTTAPIDGKLPGGASPIACPVTTSFPRGAQQVRSAAPAYDCKKRSVIGQLSHDQSAIQFPGIGRLAHGRRLTFVVLPGTIGIDRLVFAKPTRTSLSLLSFNRTTSGSSGPAPSPASTPHPSATGTTPDPVSSPPSVEVPPVSTASVPKPGTGSSPRVATSAAPAPAPAARGVAAKPLDDHRARAAALALLVGLITATGWLAVTDRGRGAAREWGVGRFRSLRSGPPPTI